jgi:regulator of nucleoside diphosphate kinase
VHSQNIRNESSAPRIVVAKTDYARLTGLAESALTRDSAVADYLLEELSRAHVVPDDACSPHVVRVGSKVTYSDDVARRTHRITVVYPWEADIERNLVSVLTPVGAALIGLSPAQSIEWPAPDGSVGYLTVLDVRTADCARGTP